MLVEGELAATGCPSLTLGYGQVGNLVQDVGALRALRSGRVRGQQRDVAPCSSIGWGASRPTRRGKRRHQPRRRDSGLAQPDKVIAKSAQEFQGVPTKEANAADCDHETASRYAEEQDIDLGGIDESGALDGRHGR